MSGSCRTHTAVAAETMANGRSTNQIRFRAIARMSSGVNVLPGSIASPSALEQREPRVHSRANRIAAEVSVVPRWQQGSLLKVVAIKRIVDPEAEMPVQRARDAG